MRPYRSSSPSMHMTTRDSSSSAAESSMDDASNHRRHNHHNHHQTLNKSKRKPVDHEEEQEEGEEGGEVWQTFNTSFNQVQSVLDRNRALIQQVNENHQSRLPDNMVKNVALIQEINGNISKVVSLYSDLSTNFSTLFQDQQRSKNGMPETPPPQR